MRGREGPRGVRLSAGEDQQGKAAVPLVDGDRPVDAVVVDTDVPVDADHVGVAPLGTVDHEGLRRQGLPLFGGETVHMRLRETSVPDLHGGAGCRSQQAGHRRRSGLPTGSLGGGTARVNQVQIHLMVLPASWRPG